ncbi:MAG TPA: hypothetical protein V6D34_00695 [Candidatus Sericytochromatia bacterium]
MESITLRVLTNGYSERNNPQCVLALAQEGKSVLTAGASWEGLPKKPTPLGKPEDMQT